MSADFYPNIGIIPHINKLILNNLDAGCKN